MSTQQSKFRTSIFSTLSVLGMLLPLASLAPINPVMAKHKPSQPTPTSQPAEPNVGERRLLPSTSQPPKQPTKMAYMESYNFSYSYLNPIANGVPVTEGYLGTGFAPVGTYRNGQTIPVLDGFGRPHGTYTIGSINDLVAYDPNKLNTISVFEYDLNQQRYTSANSSKGGIVPNNNSGGLGNERGSLTLGGSFNNQNPAFPAKAAHW